MIRRLLFRLHICMNLHECLLVPLLYHQNHQNSKYNRYWMHTTVFLNKYKYFHLANCRYQVISVLSLSFSRLIL